MSTDTLKKGKDVLAYWLFYGRFLSNSSASIAPTMATAMIMAPLVLLCRVRKGLLRLWAQLMEIKERKISRTETTSIAITIQSLLSPHSLLNCFFRTKKGESEVFVWHIYGRFLSINKASTTATTMIKANSPAMAGTKYVSAIEVGCVVAAGLMVAASPTAM